MTDITGTWVTIPDCPEYKIHRDDVPGIRIRRKDEIPGVRMGITHRGRKPHFDLQPGPDKRVALKNHPHKGAERYYPRELYDHTFKGKRLIRPAERKEIRMREAAERKAAIQLNRDMTSE